MSELARRLIAEAEADLASRLQAIEAGTGLIEEAEALAATLRHHGIAVARAGGITFAGWLNMPARCAAYVTIDPIHATELLGVLAAAGLRIAGITPGEISSSLRLDGLDVPLNVPTATAQGLIAEALAHG
jgi:hypothetical protein